MDSRKIRPLSIFSAHLMRLILRSASNGASCNLFFISSSGMVGIFGSLSIYEQDKVNQCWEVNAPQCGQSKAVSVMEGGVLLPSSFGVPYSRTIRLGVSWPQQPFPKRRGSLTTPPFPPRYASVFAGEGYAKNLHGAKTPPCSIQYAGRTVSHGYHPPNHRNGSPALPRQDFQNLLQRANGAQQQGIPEPLVVPILFHLQ